MDKKEYNKKYYEKNKETIASKLYAKVTCEKCGRKVSHQNLKKHQKSSKCKAVSYDDISTMIKELKNEVFALKEKERKAQEDKDQEEKEQQARKENAIVTAMNDLCGDKQFYRFIKDGEFEYRHVRWLRVDTEDGITPFTPIVTLISKPCILEFVEKHEEHKIEGWAGVPDNYLCTYKLVPDPDKSYSTNNDITHLGNLMGELVTEYSEA